MPICIFVSWLFIGKWLKTEFDYNKIQAPLNEKMLVLNDLKDSNVITQDEYMKKVEELYNK